MFDFLSKGKVLIGLTAIYLIFAAGLFPVYAQKMNKAAEDQNPAVVKADLKPLDLRTKYTKSEVDNFFAALGPEGQVHYHFIESKIDMAYPIVYTLFFMSLLAFLLVKNKWGNGNLKLLLLLPLLAAIPDFFENFNILKMLASGPSETLAVKGSLYSSIKWGGVLLNLGLILFLL
ncbi:MAG: hypothetical protein AAF705_04450, partial [Bacteroidota bacterium]